MNQKPIRILYTLFPIFLFATCTKSVPTTKLLMEADSLMYSNVDSVTSILDKVADSKLSDSQTADYWRLRTKLHILKGKSTVEDSLIVFALDYYKKHNMLKEQKETYKLILNHLYWKNDKSAYDFYMEEASELARQTNDSLFTYTILQTLANDFYERQDYRTAYRYYVEASEYNDSNPSTFYMAGLCYSMVENNDSIDYWMQKAIEMAKNQKDTIRVEHYYRNYASIQINSKKYDKALTHIRNMERYNTNTFNVAPYMMAEIFMQQHQLDSAQFYLTKMFEQDFGEEINKRSFSFTPKGLTLLQNIIDYAKGGTLNLRVIDQYADSLVLDQGKKIKQFEEQVLTKQKLSNQNQVLIIQKQRIQLLLLSITLIIFIVSVLTYLYIKRKKNKLYQMEEKMESIRKLLTDVSVDLKESRENSSFFKKVLLQQLGLIRHTASNPTNQNQEMLQRMAKITNDEIPVDSLIVWKDLYSLIDSLYDGFYTKMKNTFGNILSEKEIQLCCLLCANFTTKEISVITQQSVRTIYQRKTTIQEKLNMPQGCDIIEFISQ